MNNPGDADLAERLTKLAPGPGDVLLYRVPAGHSPGLTATVAADIARAVGVPVVILVDGSSLAVLSDEDLAGAGLARL